MSDESVSEVEVEEPVTFENTSFLSKLEQKPTIINFVLGTNSDRTTNDVRNAIAQIRQDLPQDINDPEHLEFSGDSVITYAVLIFHAI
ncbi:MAG: hypothetical protein V7K35_04860 [Nostoc sp.]|uniref:hypothetical protein n=1 Tax=Nostoc sp. TaxID=1180 RepID=UPI002FF5268F